MVLRVSDFTVIVKEDTQSWITDIVRVNKENEFALTTATTGIEFIKIEAATLAIQRLPLKLNNTYSKINKIRDNLLLISQGKDLFTYDTLNENKLSQCNNSSFVWSIKRLEQSDN